MSISQIDASASSLPEIVQDGANSEMDKMAFLKLLTVQLANQDPLDPMDSDTMAQQQTMFAQLEQLMNLNETMTEFVTAQGDTLLGIASVFNTLESSSFLGKDVAFFTNEVIVDEEGGRTPLFYDLTQDALVGYTVTDENGNIVKASGSQGVDAGDGISVGWDGTDANGEPVSSGKYTVTLNVLNASTNEGMSGKTYGHVRVNAIDFREGTPVLTLADGRKISVTEILALIEPEGS